jgi:hypothetical protein
LQYFPLSPFSSSASAGDIFALTAKHAIDGRNSNDTFENISGTDGCVSEIVPPSSPAIHEHLGLEACLAMFVVLRFAISIYFVVPSSFSVDLLQSSDSDVNSWRSRVWRGSECD